MQVSLGLASGLATHENLNAQQANDLWQVYQRWTSISKDRRNFSKPPGDLKTPQRLPTSRIGSLITTFAMRAKLQGRKASGGAGLYEIESNHTNAPGDEASEKDAGERLTFNPNL